VAYAEGGFTEEEFMARPGLAPVWVRFLHELQLVTLDGKTLNLIEAVI
jgi:hypothetical protein